MRKYIVIALLIIPRLMFAGELPSNSHLKLYGTGWECDRGYYKSGQQCLKVIVPENASLDITGHGWACNRGFYKSSDKCLKVIVPANASLDITGHGWACNRGFYKSGDKCLKVIVPANASLDITGNGWACNKGYKKLSNACVPMTREELQKQKEDEQAIFDKIQKRRLQGVRGDDCKTEYKTNARVCVKISGVNLDCTKDYSGNYYRDCDVVLNYNVETDYSGGSYMGVDVECKVEIEYKGRQTYSTQSDSSSDDESHSLYAHGSDSETMRFNFSFSSYKEITSVKISSAECEIESVDLW